MASKDDQQVSLIQYYGDHGVRFAAPDLLDYHMIFDIKGGDYDGKTLHITSAYHPCCGTLEVNASLASVYKRWRNKLDGCPQHRREAEGDRAIRDMVRTLWLCLEDSEDS